MVFSSTTVPQVTQKPFPAAWSYSMTVPPQSLQTAYAKKKLLARAFDRGEHDLTMLQFHK
jgi:hypothetical protein